MEDRGTVSGVRLEVQVDREHCTLTVLFGSKPKFLAGFSGRFRMKR